MKHTTVTIDISYDYITYDGTNADQVYKFAVDSHIAAPGEISDNFEKRPEGIPHMCYEDLLNWWLSTGQIKEETYRGETYTVNTHGVMNDRCIDIHMSYDIGYNTFPESWLCTGKDDTNTQEYKFSETVELIPFDVFIPAMHKLIDDYAMQSKVND